ncbi:MAG: MarR family transcriptional regulator/GNAT family N-acetyltransferase [Deltaproteobacteria bacterium]|nr:MarR family transcriptional regulator/GNAT family N-acetyltransferase [Deltaproteobacteria bacterium]
MSFYRNHRDLVFGSWLRRIADKFLSDISRVYKSLDIPFETGWFPIFYLLNERGILSVTEIANELEITHSAVSQMVAALEAKKLVSFVDDKSDKRRRLIRFSKQGQALMERLKPIWKTIRQQMDLLLAERDNSAYLTIALQEMEESMEKRSVYDRVMTALEKEEIDQLEIVSFDKSHQHEYKDLMLHWLMDNRGTDVLEDTLINDPEKLVEKGKALILLARIDGKCIGTIVAAIDTMDESRIVFFFVDEKWRNRLVGQRLLSELINELQFKKSRRVVVELDRKYTHAIKLVKTMGFRLKSTNSGQGAEGRRSMILVLEKDIAQ